MEKRQSELCLEILRRFNKTGILKDFILIGSWCVYFYKDYFSNVPYIDQATIKGRVEDFYVTLPHPANFALHKLIIFQRRIKQDKAVKDRNIAIEVLKSLINKGESSVINQVFDSIPKKWQARVVKGLDKSEDRDIFATLLNLETR